MKQSSTVLVLFFVLGFLPVVFAQQRIQFGSRAPGLIYTSSDSGNTWEAHESNRQWSAVASSADGRKLVAADFGLRDRKYGGTHNSSGGRIYTSTNFGATWMPQFTNKFWNCVASSTDGTRLIAGTFGDGIYTSSDSGVTWTAHEEGLNWVSVASSADGRKLVAIPFGCQIHTSSDFGATWTKRETNRYWVAVASSADGNKTRRGRTAGQYDLHVHRFRRNMDGT
jgi:hypothetical protein